jgi:hypothetical protein
MQASKLGFVLIVRFPQLFHVEQLWKTFQDCLLRRW